MLRREVGIAHGPAEAMAVITNHVVLQLIDVASRMPSIAWPCKVPCMKRSRMACTYSHAESVEVQLMLSRSCAYYSHL